MGNYSPSKGSIMPLYEYNCQACGKNFEKLQPYEGRDLVSCPDCGSRVDRKISTFSWKMFNPFTTDGEGYSTKFMRHEEIAEIEEGYGEVH